MKKLTLFFTLSTLYLQAQFNQGNNIQIQDASANAAYDMIDKWLGYACLGACLFFIGKIVISMMAKEETQGKIGTNLLFLLLSAILWGIRGTLVRLFIR